MAKHERGSYFQSEACMHHIISMAHAEPLLLLAVRQQRLKDPGMRYKPDQPGAASQQAEAMAATVDHHSLAGSLLAVVLTREARGIWKIGPLRGLHRRLCTRTLIIGGPLLARGSRLESEYTLKALVQTLCQQAQCRAKTTRFILLFDDSDLLPLFREMGFRWQQQTFPPGETFFMDAYIARQLESLPPEMGKGYGSFVG